MTARRFYVSIALLLLSPTLLAGPLRDRIKERIAERQQSRQEAGETQGNGTVSSPVGRPATNQSVQRNLSYGSDPKQTLDVYLPDHHEANAPVIFMVHGGAWKIGDKDHSKVVQNKLARWLPKGFIFISVNYPMLPQADPLKQADYVAQALAYAQSHVSQWGGDSNRFILMGHSAGAHLVSLLSADPTIAFSQGARPWLGTVSLDSAAMDVVQIMSAKHYGFYDEAFGKDSDYWRRSSPLYRITSKAPPLLMVCSSRRSESCGQADGFAHKAKSLGVPASVLTQNLTHSEINDKLGLAGPYTDQVETFMASLDPSISAQLSQQP